MTLLKLTGECNQCGLCCQARYRGRTVTCEHLERRGEVGLPDATQCLVYDRRWDGMPIRMMSDDREYIIPTRCAKGSVTEIVQQIARIGEGCSFKVEVVDAAV